MVIVLHFIVFRRNLYMYICARLWFFYKKQGVNYLGSSRILQLEVILFWLKLVGSAINRQASRIAGGLPATKYDFLPSPPSSPPTGALGQVQVL